jgi:DNA mismatch repair protein MutL
MPQGIPGVLAGGVYSSRWAPPGLELPAERGAPTETPVESAGLTAPMAAPAAMRPLIPLGQFRSTFILAIDDEGIAIVDQHVAHERVLFERMMQRLTGQRLESQGLLIPLLLELAPGEREALLSRRDALERSGFEIDEFGADTIRVTAAPAILPRDECDRALRALATDLEGLDRGLGMHEALKRIAALTACHAAVKANDPLTMEKMAHILEELRATAYSTVCPHGRPVMLRLTRREIEKNFERI